MPVLAFTLTHPEAPKSMNAGGGGSRRHWAVAHREKQRWQDIFYVLLLDAKVPQGMDRCDASAVIRWKQKRVGGRERDSTNYLAPLIKPLADTLAPPDFLFAGTGNARIAVPNKAPRWLPDDTDEFFTFTGLKFEYPSPWSHRDPRVKAELVVRLEASYPDRQPAASQALQGFRDAA